MLTMRNSMALLRKPWNTPKARQLSVNTARGAREPVSADENSSKTPPRKQRTFLPRSRHMPLKKVKIHSNASGFNGRPDSSIAAALKTLVAL